jgi:isoleucyl-tRNA synthetase
MSKSTGNFLTLRDAVKKYGADATRIALADAGDAIEDANFEETVANSSILRLFTLKQWCEEITQDQGLRNGPADTLWDKLFENEMNVLVHDAELHYEEYVGLSRGCYDMLYCVRTNYKVALRSAFYDFISARDFYREAVTAAGSVGMHAGLIRRYMELQALIVAPILPHWADYIWSEVLAKVTICCLVAPVLLANSVSLTQSRPNCDRLFPSHHPLSLKSTLTCVLPARVSTPPLPSNRRRKIRAKLPRSIPKSRSRLLFSWLPITLSGRNNPSKSCRMLGARRQKPSMKSNGTSRLPSLETQRE